MRPFPTRVARGVVRVEWMLLEYPANKNVHFYPCCVEPFPDLTYTIRVKRIAAVLLVPPTRQ